jgi:hypothetical protein
MNPLERACLRCGAAAGQKCRHYRGQGTATCKDRLTDGALDAQAGRRAAARAIREDGYAVRILWGDGIDDATDEANRD